MIEQLGRPVKFVAFFVGLNGDGATGVPITVSIYNPLGIKIIDSAMVLELGDGLYSYELSEALTTIVGEYVALFSTTSNQVMSKQVPSMWIIGRGGVENLDVRVSSRMGTTVDEADPVVGRPRLWSYRLTLLDNITPITSANIWITNDPGGSNVLASGLTNQRGEVSFYFRPGTIYVWRRKAGYRFDNPDMEVIA